MLITAVEEYTKSKYKIYIDEQFAFVLYKGELRRYGISINDEITEADYQDIMQNVIIKRAKKRLLYLLKSKDYTENELRKKLKEGYYPQMAQDAAIEYVKSYKYLNDEEYARRYVEYKASSKSLKMIRMELLNKGIKENIVNDILEEIEIDECDLIINSIRKKKYDIYNEDSKIKNKMYMYLIRKGFQYDKISEAIQRMKFEEY